MEPAEQSPNNYTDVWIPQSLREFIGELNSEAVSDYDVIVIDTLGRFGRTVGKEA